MKVVLATGTFDLLHPGHIFYLKEAKNLGDYLVVIVASDTTLKAKKGTGIFSSNERYELISAVRFVDEVHIGYDKNHYKIVKELSPDIIALGYDQMTDTKKLENYIQTLKKVPEIVRLPKYSKEGLSQSRKIIQKVTTTRFTY